MTWLIIIIIIVGIFFLFQNSENNSYNSSNKNINTTNNYSVQLNEKGLSKTFPNFVLFNKSAPVKGMELVVDDVSNIEFKSPIITYGIIKGYTHLGIKVEGQMKMYGFTIVKSGKKFNGGTIVLNRDLSVDEYNEKMGLIIGAIMSDPDYFNHVV